MHSSRSFQFAELTTKQKMKLTNNLPEWCMLGCLDKAGKSYRVQYIGGRSSTSSTETQPRSSINCLPRNWTLHKTKLSGDWVNLTSLFQNVIYVCEQSLVRESLFCYTWWLRWVQHDPTGEFYTSWTSTV